MNEEAIYRELAALLDELAREGVFDASLAQLIKEARAYWRWQDEEMMKLKAWLIKTEMEENYEEPN